MMATSQPSFGLPWLAVNVTFALQVFDEATSSFLDWYNPRALQVRGVLKGLPFPPTFTFWPWLFGLVSAVLALFALTPFAFRGAAWLRSVAFVVGIIQAGNGVLHLTAAGVTRRCRGPERGGSPPEYVWADGGGHPTDQTPG
jgi:hypothetical protein